MSGRIRAGIGRLFEWALWVFVAPSLMGGIAWITKGKEVENYLSATTVNSLLGIATARQVEQYEDFFDCLNDIQPGKGSYYSVRKPLLAERVSRFITREHMETILDLAEMMDATCLRIRQWNGL